MPIPEKKLNIRLIQRLLLKTMNMRELVDAYNSTKGIEEKIAISTMYRKFNQNKIPLTNFVPGSGARKIRATTADRVMSGISINRRLDYKLYGEVYNYFNCSCVNCGMEKPADMKMGSVFIIRYKDRDHTNTQIDNLKLVCKVCRKIA